MARRNSTVTASIVTVSGRRLIFSPLRFSAAEQFWAFLLMQQQQQPVAKVLTIAGSDSGG